ncbi:MAG: SDR family oxidoreductase [Candidatus Latescibacterota bacterium]
MIRDFYRGRTVFLTGATGFVGRGLSSRILRDLPEVERLYVLIRPRAQPGGRSLTAAERLQQDLLASDAFAAFRRADPAGFGAACAKVVAVEGELGPGLGLGPADRQRLAAEVDVIISVAATVTFDEPLDRSIQLNALGPQELLALARQCRREPVFVQVSTAYVSGRRRGRIPEQPLPLDRTIRQMMDGSEPATPFDPEAEIAACQAACHGVRELAASPAQQQVFRRQIQAQSRGRRLSDRRLAQLVEDRTRRWTERQLVELGMERAHAYGCNDVYTFTKALGEQMLVKHHGGIPLAIVRPSIIESSLRDPEPGWVFGLKVAEPLIIAYGRGMVPDFPAHRHQPIDMVPVDIVVNTTLAAATQARPGTVPVFHAATSAENPLTVEALYHHVREYFRQHPMRLPNGQAPALPAWTFPSVRSFRRWFRWRYLYPLRLALAVLDRLPERLGSGPRKRRLTALEKRLRRVLYYTDLFSPYTTLACQFEFHRTREVFASLPAHEQDLFPMDVSRIDWRRYFLEVHLPGLRRHVLREEGGEEVLLRGTPEEAGVEEERWQTEAALDTLPDLLRWAGWRYGERPALQVEGRPASACTYAGLLAQVEGMACRWQRLGLQPPDRLGLVGESGPAWVTAYLAAVTLGLTVVPFDPEAAPEELWSLGAFAGLRALVAPGRAWVRLGTPPAGTCPAGLLRLDLDRGGIGVDGPVPAAQTTGPARWRPPAVDPDQPASILFTAGAPVTPRGVVLTHRNLVSSVLALAEVYRLQESDCLLSVLPLHYCVELVAGMLLPLLCGARITYLGTLNSREILRAARAARATVLVAAPRILKIVGDRVERLAALARDSGGSAEPEPLQPLRLVACRGPLPAEVRQVYTRRGVAVCEGYGLTEAGSVVAVTPPDGAPPGSVGQPLPRVEVRVEADTPGAEGEILVRGPCVAPGYLDQPEQTRRLLRDGWLHTGDLGRMDGDGYLYLTGRRDGLILTGEGRKVLPEEVEALHQGLPRVGELCVVGVPSPRTLGDEVHAVAVLARGGADGADDRAAQGVTEEVRRRARGLPAHRRIVQLHLWRRPLPRLDSGEVDRAALRAQLALEGHGEDEAARALAGMTPAEREICRHVARIAGLGVTEVSALAEAPLDTLMDSLMAAEFAVLLEAWAGGGALPLDRGRRSLRQILDDLGPRLEGCVPELQPGKQRDGSPFWEDVLCRGRAEGGDRSAGVGPRLLQDLVWGLGGPFFRRFFSLGARGLEQLPQDRPYLLAANHASHLDAAAVLAAVRPHVDRCYLVAGRDYFAGAPWRGRLLRLVANAIPVDRHGDFRAGLRAASRLLGVRRPLLIFPEGTRSPSGHLQPLKPGVGLLACELGVPVVPLHIRGTYEALPRGRRRPGHHPIRLLFGAPLEPPPQARRRGGENRYDAYREVVEELRCQLERLAADNP